MRDDTFLHLHGRRPRSEDAPYDDGVRRLRPWALHDDWQTPRIAFVSYAREDSVDAWTVAMVLLALGYEVIFDRLYLHSGDDWRDRLASAIAHADLFVLLWSSHAHRSEAVLWEIECACRRLRAVGGKQPIKVLPFALESLEEIGPPPGLEHLHVPEPPLTWFEAMAKDEIDKFSGWTHWFGATRRNTGRRRTGGNPRASFSHRRGQPAPRSRPNRRGARET